MLGLLHCQFGTGPVVGDHTIAAGFCEEAGLSQTSSFAATAGVETDGIEPSTWD